MKTVPNRTLHSSFSRSMNKMNLCLSKLQYILLKCLASSIATTELNSPICLFKMSALLSKILGFLRRKFKNVGVWKHLCCSKELWVPWVSCREKLSRLLFFLNKALKTPLLSLPNLFMKISTILSSLCSKSINWLKQEWPMPWKKP